METIALLPKKGHSKLRVSVSLDTNQELPVREYLLRASCFWNYLVDSLDKEIGLFLDTKDEQILNLIEKKSMELMKYVTDYAENGFIHEQFPERWKSQLVEMAQLDEHTLWGRYTEFLDAIKHAANENDKDRRPRMKNESSAQAASFNVSCCEIRDRRLLIKGPWKADIPLDQDVDLSQYETVIIGKRATPSKETLRLLGPQKDNYFVLFIA